VLIGGGFDYYHAIEVCAALTERGCSVWVNWPRGGTTGLVERMLTDAGARQRQPVAEEEVAALDALTLGLCMDESDLEDAAFESCAVRVQAVGPGQLVRVTRSSNEAGDVALVIEGDEQRLNGCRAYAAAVLDAVDFARGRQHGDFAGVRLVVTAGGTREALDPVRTISNRSSGRMGHALAKAAVRRGGDVTLITSAPQLVTPVGAKVEQYSDVTSLRASVLAATAAASILIMAAAVSDFRPVRVYSQKMKKGADGLTLRLESIPNFLPEVADGVFRIGFAAETHIDLEYAQCKLLVRGFDLLCLNDVSAKDSGFEVETNKVWLIDGRGLIQETAVMPKEQLAHRILDTVRDQYPSALRKQAGVIPI